LDSNHYDFANKPKGILPFHKYSTHITTPIEEHLTESVFYATANGESNLQFTISENHQNQFENIIKTYKKN